MKRNKTVSGRFYCSNGIKQGGVLSPTLFCVYMYMDGILKRIASSNVGCHIEHQFTGTFSYANDFSILAPSLKAAQLMLEICEDYAKSMTSYLIVQKVYYC